MRTCGKTRSSRISAAARVPARTRFRKTHIPYDICLQCIPMSGKKWSPAGAAGGYPSSSRATRRKNAARRGRLFPLPGNMPRERPACPCAPRNGHPACQSPFRKHWYRPLPWFFRSSSLPGVSSFAHGGGRHGRMTMKCRRQRARRRVPRSSSGCGHTRFPCPGRRCRYLSSAPSCLRICGQCRTGSAFRIRFSAMSFP